MALDVRDVHRRLGLPVDRESVALVVNSRANQQKITLPLAWTDCNYGGRRPWWRCPSCGRRCAVLLRRGGRYACRSCHGLSYRSQRCKKDLFPVEKAERRLARISKRLGLDCQAKGELKNHPPQQRPVGMHRRTYERLSQEWWEAWEALDRAESEYWLDGLARVMRLYSRLT